MNKPIYFSIYNASAGSGKTYTLVKEYLKMTFQNANNDSFRRILAITFTNKAAAEMKERVIAALEGIAGSNPSFDKLLNTLSEETGKEKEELKTLSGRILRAILHQYSDFSISTIDSFMHRVVRTFAFDLHLPVTFSVELKKENLIEQAVDQLIAQAGYNEEITKILKGFTESRTEEEKNFQIRNEIIATASDLLDDQKAMAIGLLNKFKPNDFLQLRTEFIQSIKSCELKMQELGKKGLLMLEENGLSPEVFYYGKKGVPGFFEKAASFTINSKPLGNSYVEAAVSMDKWTGKTASKQTVDQINTISEDLKALIESIYSFDSGEASTARLHALLLNEVFSMALLNEISGIIDSIRNEHHLMHISEFNRRVAEIVFHEPAPFIFERLGEKYHHYLIDEFQDTSVLQWQNLLPLVHNGLASNADSLIVGDGKQAIYRFRGGDVEQFIRLPNPYPEALTEYQLERYNLIQQVERKVPLETNFRSLPEIVNWNNSFFNFTADTWLTGEYKDVYAGLNQKHAEGKSGGFVQIEFLDIHVSDEEDFSPASRVIQIITDCINNKNYKYADIAVLTRSNREGNTLAAELLHADIPVISSESLMVASSDEVKFLLSWFRVLANNNTDVNLLQILHYLIENQKLPFYSLESLLEQIPFSEERIYDLLRSQGFSINIPLWRTQALPETSHQLCRCFGLEIQLNPFLQFFLEAVWFSTQQISPDIPGFLDYWDESGHKLSISLPQNANAVKIMTIHKAKGLEFPVVIFPCGGNEKKKTGYQWITDENRLPFGMPAMKLKISSQLLRTPFADVYEAEENKRSLDLINLLYVATTRPEEALYMLCDEFSPDSEATGWSSYLSRYCLEKSEDNKVADGVYRWGDAGFQASPHGRKKSAIREEKGMAYACNGWTEKINIAKVSDKIWESQNESESLAFGKLMHLALSWTIRKEDAKPAVERLVEEGHARAEDAQRILTHIMALIEMPELNSIYEAERIYTERSLMDEEGNIHRPDRVAITGNTLWIVDYKTGMQHDKHREQLRRYIQKIKAVEKGKEISAMLVYLKSTPEISILQDRN